jgi:hypothetical protein
MVPSRGSGTARTSVAGALAEMAQPATAATTTTAAMPAQAWLARTDRGPSAGSAASTGKKQDQRRDDARDERPSVGPHLPEGPDERQENGEGIERRALGTKNADEYAGSQKSKAGKEVVPGSAQTGEPDAAGQQDEADQGNDGSENADGPKGGDG